MRWFDRNFDYVNEFVENWNKRAQRLKTVLAVIAVVLVLVGLSCAFAPAETLWAMQVLAAVALVAQGVYSIVAYASSTWHFKDPMQVVVGVLTVVLGVLVLAAPVTLTATLLAYLFAFLLIFSGAEKISFAARMKYYRIANAGAITACGVVNIVLAVLMLVFPLVTMLALNYVLAAYLIVGGVTLLVEALSMRKITL